MCWNADISINTFLFSCFALSFIYLTNTYTKYKTPSFDHPLVYLFFGFVVSMQLIEYFVWKNLNNNRVNTLLSKLISANVMIQPFILMWMIESSLIRYTILGLYVLSVVLFRLYKVFLSPFMFHTSVYNGHLKWDWIKTTGLEGAMQLIYLAFYLAALLLIQNPVLTLFGLVTMIVSFFFYFKDGTFGSMWCWVINLFLLYFIVHILLIQPFMEYKGLC